jgi:GNAT superfamily N-acetyltransferase
MQMIDLKQYSAKETLRNGLVVTIRALRPDDCERMDEAFRKLDKGSIYTRFFSYKKELNQHDFETIRTLDFDTRVALIVTVMEAGKEVVIASSSYTKMTDCEAEVAFIVEEDYHRLGIAGRLLRHLGQIAQERGISIFVADVLPGNNGMLSVFRSVGWPLQSKTEDGVVQVTLSITNTGI